MFSPCFVGAGSNPRPQQHQGFASPDHLHVLASSLRSCSSGRSDGPPLTLPGTGIVPLSTPLPSVEKHSFECFPPTGRGMRLIWLVVRLVALIGAVAPGAPGLRRSLECGFGVDMEDWPRLLGGASVG